MIISKSDRHLLREAVNSGILFQMVSAQNYAFLYRSDNVKSSKVPISHTRRSHPVSVSLLFCLPKGVLYWPSYPTIVEKQRAEMLDRRWLKYGQQVVMPKWSGDADGNDYRNLIYETAVMVVNKNSNQSQMLKTSLFTL